MFKIQFHKNNENNEPFKKLKFIFTLLITPISPCTKILSDTYTITTSLKCKISKNVEKHRAIVFKHFKWKMEILSKNRHFKYNSNQFVFEIQSITVNLTAKIFQNSPKQTRHTLVLWEVKGSNFRATQACPRSGRDRDTAEVKSPRTPANEIHGCPVHSLSMVMLVHLADGDR